MLLLPADMLALLTHFAPLFSRRTWRHVPLLVVGALLAPARPCSPLLAPARPCSPLVDAWSVRPYERWD
jgi:hypothetical protein